MLKIIIKNHKSNSNFSFGKLDVVWLRKAYKKD